GGMGGFQVSAPLLASAASNYEVRYNTGAGNKSATFSVVASRFQAKAGSRSVILSNGAQISFSAPAVPTASQPAVACAVQTGAAMAIEWDYNASNACGTYKITFPSRSKWITTTCSNSTGTTGL